MLSRISRRGEWLLLVVLFLLWRFPASNEANARPRFVTPALFAPALFAPALFASELFAAPFADPLLLLVYSFIVAKW